jgi:hypothetical protein
MRTKTTLLCAAALAAGVVGSMAQSNVYSLNIVGYVNVVIPTGFGLVANPLNVDNTNSAGTILTSLAPLGNGTTPPGDLDYFYLYTWVVGSQKFTSVYYEDDFNPTANPGLPATAGWATDSSGGTAATPPNLPPGVGFLIDSSLAPLTNTFVGSVMPLVGATNSISIPTGFGYLGSMLPVSGPITNTSFQFPLAPLGNGTTPAGTIDYFYFYSYNVPAQKYTSVYYEDDFNPTANPGLPATSGWATDSSGGTSAPPPSVALGQGFAIDSSIAPVTWSQTYPIP